jgi:D-alanyl-D-alanine carboxypeptidase
MKKFLFALLLVSSSCFAGVTAKSYVVTDDLGSVLVEKNSYDVRSIASITKLMTAMVVLDANLDLDEQISIEHIKGYKSHLPRSVKVLSRQELLNLALVKSDNVAAYNLCASYPGGMDRCVAEMNHKAFSLGMTNTHYDDPTGLDIDNVSTAQDLVKLVFAAELYPEIVNASSMSKVDLQIKKHWWHFGNTNPLVGRDDIKVSKTGFINNSGGCVVMMISNRVIVLLGSRNTHTRFPEAKKILASI